MRQMQHWVFFFYVGLLIVSLFVTNFKMHICDVWRMTKRKGLLFPHSVTKSVIVNLLHVIHIDIRGSNFDQL